MTEIRRGERCEDLASKQDTKHKNRGQEQNKPPTDGGWGWAVCLGALAVNFLTVGQQNSAGVVYSAILNELSTQRGETGKSGAATLEILRLSYLTQS